MRLLGMNFKDSRFEIFRVMGLWRTFGANSKGNRQMFDTDLIKNMEEDLNDAVDDKVCT